jgi:hypothetical protein
MLLYLLGQCCGSGMFMPDPGSEFFHPGSRVKKIPDPHRRLYSRKNDLGCPSRSVSGFFFFHPVSRGQKSTGSRIRIRNTVLGYGKFLNLLSTVHKVHFTFVCKVEKLRYKKREWRMVKKTTFLVDKPGSGSALR